MLKDELDTPTLLVDMDRLTANIDDMADFAAKHGVSLRPHAKTHKTAEIGKMQMDAGAVGLTVAKVSEAEIFVDKGLTDLLIAYPIVGPIKQRRLFSLLERGADVTTIVDHQEIASGLSQAAVHYGHELPVMVDVDVGMRRTGVLAGKPTVELALEVARLPGLRLQGLLTHEGHSIMAGDPEQVRSTALAAGETLVRTADLVRAAGLEVAVVSVGLTVASKITPTIDGITESRPGTYAFYDRSSALHGTPWEQCAATVLATVVTRPAPDRAYLDSGSKTLTSDAPLMKPHTPGYGHVVGHPDWTISALSEEHAWVTIPRDDPVRIGDRVEVIPNHICPSVNLFDEMTLVRGDTVVGQWEVAARGKKQ